MLNPESRSSQHAATLEYYGAIPAEWVIRDINKSPVQAQTHLNMATAEFAAAAAAAAGAGAHPPPHHPLAHAVMGQPIIDMGLNGDSGDSRKRPLELDGDGEAGFAKRTHIVMSPSPNSGGKCCVCYRHFFFNLPMYCTLFTLLSMINIQGGGKVISLPGRD